MVNVKTTIYNSYLPENNTITENYKNFTGAPPKGFSRIKNVPIAAQSIAKSLLGGDYGTLTPFDIGNEKFVARVEPHYHSPESGIKPIGWHKGVTVYKAIKQNNFYNDSTSESLPKNNLLEKLDKFLSNLV